MFRKLLLHGAAHPREGWETMRILRSYRNAQESMRGHDVEYPDLQEAQIRFASEHSRCDEALVRRCVEMWMQEQPLPHLLLHRMPKLLELLQELKKRGVRTAVCSDYPAVEKLHALEIGNYFDVIKTAQDADVRRFKPHPRSLEAALAALSIPPEEAVYFGDRPEVDGEAAARAGVAFFAISQNSGFEPVLNMLAKGAGL